MGTPPLALIDKILYNSARKMSEWKESIKLLVASPVFLSCVASWLCAQFMKTVIALCYGKVHTLGQLIEMMLWRTGGFPSSHTAAVSALCTAVSFRSGVTSDLFMLSFCFLFVTIRDALGVRRANGIQARRINEIGRVLSERGIVAFKPIKEINGHKPLEVFAGLSLGFSIGLAFSLL